MAVRVRLDSSAARSIFPALAASARLALAALPFEVRLWA